MQNKEQGTVAGSPQTPPNPSNESSVASDQVADATPQLPTIEPVSWTASESVAQQRSGRWYAIVSIVFVVLLATDILLFIFHVVDIVALISFGALIVVMFIALLISTKLPGRELTYVLSADGIAINGQQHHFDEFRAFGVRQHGGLWQLVLIPVKRFGLEVVAFIDEQHGERIVDLLASFLPMEEVPENGIDKLIEKFKI